MSFRTTFLPSLLHARPSPISCSRRSLHTPASFLRAREAAKRGDSPIIAIARQAPSRSQSSRFSPLGLGIAASIALTGFGLFNPSRQTRCEALYSSSPASPVGTSTIGSSGDSTEGTAPGSILSVYELSFGAVCGICAGVFVKKGAKAIAFLLGGVFVLLQYMSSKSYISVDWARLSNKYETAFGGKTPTGKYNGPTIGGVWNRIVDFLTANFQQRASFMAGLALGLRLG
ncbi:hypothetical protein CI109_100600 [Kwoniella shandongensis]|uniref:Uncharacterized protein n=1 Tax=Kwoniella shandongensis TaxID=1734106 RepID=A0A5M6C4T0_9TREE|nr:uncharacterized protein CI109_003478 [Kwoniella shandongensis]KAA5528189.1 hypothetical protein CI109_003478 [Kwoniella shandongensis]